MKNSRRNFLKSSALLSASVLIPDFLHAFNAFSEPRNFSGKRLVIIQLSGGNDGLNCVVPYRNDNYFKLRPSLALQEKQRISITDDVALNLHLGELADLYNEGNLCIINNVGYPNPNRSHFRSTDIWHSASDENQYLSTGWIGRYMDETSRRDLIFPHQAMEIDDTLSLMLKGEQLKGLAFHDPEVLKLSSNNNHLEKIIQGHFHHHEEHVASFLHKTLRETSQSADYVYQKSKIYKSSITYPLSDFGQRMKQIAELICSDCETQVYYISLPGFDTHAAQSSTHKRVLQTYSKTVKAFCSDLKLNNKFDDTVIFTFSEFGRRVKQNGSKGTDHGTANNVYIINGKLKKSGILNELPDLENLEEGDLKFTVDFRQIYATLLEDVLQTSALSILNKPFEKLPFL